MCATTKKNVSSAKATALRVDLRAATSKYIGETEKNLRRTLTPAKASDALLLFDEADALLGKRTEVKDAHDRFANIEVAALTPPKRRKKKKQS